MYRLTRIDSSLKNPPGPGEGGRMIFEDFLFFYNIDLHRPKTNVSFDLSRQ